MKFEGSFKVAGKPEDIIVKFTDVPRMARCMPGATIEGQDEEGNYTGVIVVAFGPKKIKFKGKMSCEFNIPQCSGVLKGRGAADMRAARVGLQTHFAVKPDPASDADNPVSIVSINSEAELGGVIADFAKTGGTALANVLMKDFANNLAAEFARDEASEPTEAKAISAHKVIWSAVKSKFGSSETE